MSTAITEDQIKEGINILKSYPFVNLMKTSIGFTIFGEIMRANLVMRTRKLTEEDIVKKIAEMMYRNKDELGISKTSPKTKDVSDTIKGNIFQKVKNSFEYYCQKNGKSFEQARDEVIIKLKQINPKIAEFLQSRGTDKLFPSAAKNDFKDNDAFKKEYSDFFKLFFDIEVKGTAHVLIESQKFYIDFLMQPIENYDKYYEKLGFLSGKQNQISTEYHFSKNPPSSILNEEEEKKDDDVIKPAEVVATLNIQNVLNSDDW